MSEPISVWPRHGLSRPLAQPRGHLRTARRLDRGVTRATLAIIGGTGLNRLAGALASAIASRRRMAPRRRSPQIGRIGAHDVIFLARHGQPHRTRAAPDQLSREPLAVARTRRDGGAGDECGRLDRAAMAPGDLVVPHQIIDYTWGRAHTYMDTHAARRHVDFSAPYDATLRDRLRVGGAGARARLRGVRFAASMAARKDLGSRAQPRSIAWRATAATSSA